MAGPDSALTIYSNPKMLKDQAPDTGKKGECELALWHCEEIKKDPGNFLTYFARTQEYTRLLEDEDYRKIIADALDALLSDRQRSKLLVESVQRASYAIRRELAKYFPNLNSISGEEEAVFPSYFTSELERLSTGDPSLSYDELLGSILMSRCNLQVGEACMKKLEGKTPEILGDRPDLVFTDRRKIREYFPDFDLQAWEPRLMEDIESHPEVVERIAHAIQGRPYRITPTEQEMLAELESFFTLAERYEKEEVVRAMTREALMKRFNGEIEGVSRSVRDQDIKALHSTPTISFFVGITLLLKQLVDEQGSREISLQTKDAIASIIDRIEAEMRAKFQKMSGRERDKDRSRVGHSEKLKQWADMFLADPIVRDYLLDREVAIHRDPDLKPPIVLNFNRVENFLSWLNGGRDWSDRELVYLTEAVTDDPRVIGAVQGLFRNAARSTVNPDPRIASLRDLFPSIAIKGDI
jgi:hypothetical protein